MQPTESQERALIDLVRSVARSEIMPRYRSSKGLSTRTKSRFDDLVTEADLASERALTLGVVDIFPGALVVGEEGVSEDRTILDHLAEAPVAVVIDPIDGTWNFAHGVNSHGVIIAILHRGETVLGLLYDSVMDDIIIARKGAGCWFERTDGEQERISIGALPADAKLTGFVAPATFAPEKRATVYSIISQYDRVETLRCCCHEYRTLAQGGADFFVYPKNNVWDNAAGILAVQEAGGAVSMLDGQPYMPRMTTGVIVAAKSERLVQEVREAFKPIQ